jgi:tetratricopeptide (TPR) repeat protein
MTKIRSRQQTGLTKITKPNQAFIQQQLIELDELIIAQEWQAAEVEALKLFNATPTGLGVLERIVTVLRERCEWDKLAELLLKARNNYGLWPNGSNLQLGQALLEQGKIEQARNFLEQALNDIDCEGWANHFLGKALRQLGELEQALDHQLNATELLPDFMWAPFESAHILRQLNRPLEAVAEAHEAKRRCKVDVNPLVNQLLNELEPAQKALEIDELIECGDQDAAFSAMRRELIKHPSDPEIRQRARKILNNSESTIDAIPLNLVEAELQDFKLLLDAFEADLERQGF